MTVISSNADAAFATYSDKNLFLSQTAATSATGGTISSDPPVVLVNSYTQGQTTFDGPNKLTIGCPSSGVLNYCQPDGWAPLLNGDDIAVTGVEDLDAIFNSSPVFAVGFEMIEPTLLNIGPGQTFVDSTFTITLISGVTNKDSFIFKPGNDVVVFFGVWTDYSFDKISIRETVGGIENEFFGEFWTNAAPLSTVPVPAAAWLFGSGLIGLFGLARRKKA